MVHGAQRWALDFYLNQEPKVTGVLALAIVRPLAASGLRDFEIEFQVNGGATQMVLMDLHRQGLFSFTAIKEFTFKNSDAFNLEFGFSANASGATFYTVKDGSALDPTSVQVLRLLRPGGIVFGISYLFRLNKSAAGE